MKSIAFLDTEIEPQRGLILDIGCVKDSGALFRAASVADLTVFLRDINYICGHNILNHDLQYLAKAVSDPFFNKVTVIDTLFLSPLLFPAKPYHNLLKDDKLQTEERNSPLNDSLKARDLFYDEVAAFQKADHHMRLIYWLLLKDQPEFRGFFRYISFTGPGIGTESIIRRRFHSFICHNADLTRMITDYPVELAYSLAIISADDRQSITPPWVLKNFPAVDNLISQLRSDPCLSGCPYCARALDIHRSLKAFFGYDGYRSYAGEALQENAVRAAVQNKSLLAVFPTGGGKSITFQIPALMAGASVKGLTVIISPLQSLMKDQVDNLEKAGITEAVTINGLLDPIERAKSIERVENGSASILYISPESLRSRTVEKLILGRKTVRFVIDEAHCFSAWGQDFRVDYLYIGDFIKSIQEKKNLETPIPVSCFTATAKQKVIEDIRDYFRQKLSLELELFTSKASRTNLKYRVFQRAEEDEKYKTLRDLLEQHHSPTIVYVSRTRKAFDLAKRLSDDGFNARPYHGKMDVKEKTANQNAFIAGEVPVMVATSAFGMGVDKKDVGMVIHYEISDSLENYVQEAGRAGRDENIEADCYILFNEEDLSKHFILLNQTRLSMREIQQIWKTIKEITRFRSTVSISALEIARHAGWDDSLGDIETRVTTAIAALEQAGYVKRGHNSPRIFANSIMVKNAQEAIDRINSSTHFTQTQKQPAVRIIKKLFSGKSKSNIEEAGETRIDYICDHLGIVKEEVINIINLLREENILADAKDLTVWLRTNENINRSLNILKTYIRIENFLLPFMQQEAQTIHIKQLNEEAAANGCADVSPKKIKTVLNFWSLRNWIKRSRSHLSGYHMVIMAQQNQESLREKLEKRHLISAFILEYLFTKNQLDSLENPTENAETPVRFSVLEIREEYEKLPQLFEIKITANDVEEALFFLSRIEAIRIEGGFLVIYNTLTIKRTEADNYKRFTRDDYDKLNRFYENKVQQIHIVGEYAHRMITDNRDALQFTEDYFQLNYTSFLRKYFPGSKVDTLKLKMTPGKFQQLFGELSPPQLKIINDSENKHIVVAAGPGSGKTRVLVHKLASLLLMEDVKHEQLLMLTFSRAAATEFKKRLIQLIGNAAHFIEIKTFHAYCFDLLGRMGNLEKSESVIRDAISLIKNKEVENSRIMKAVLVIDEAQDMDRDEYELITTLMEQNEDMRVIAVGDDDQNIFQFRGADSRNLLHFIETHRAARHELLVNYRSRNNLVSYTSQVAALITKRLKNAPIIPAQTQNGKIQIVYHSFGNLSTPLVDDVLSWDLCGSTCVITRTNSEAVQLAGLLLKYGVRAKLIQSNDGFSLYNIVEVRFFMDQLKMRPDVFLISDEDWARACHKLAQQYHKSSQLEAVQQLIRDFELTHIRKYSSDLETFVRESSLQDFVSGKGDTVFVSTIHKTKGKEFDNVFLMLENTNLNTDEEIRLAYVAMTRAKANLSIHLNSAFLNHLELDGLVRIHNTQRHAAPAQIAMQLSHKDVWLDYFVNRQHLLSGLVSGDALDLDGTDGLKANGKTVVKFSQQFLIQMARLNIKNYHLKSAKINFIVYWSKESLAREIKVILPELIFERE